MVSFIQASIATIAYIIRKRAITYFPVVFTYIFALNLEPK